ncbi:MAG: type II toxin-antitoxin system RelE family toxin [Tepidisphaeraceae bacterium]
MRYEIQFKPQAQRDLDRLSVDVARRIVRKIEAMRSNLAGDVKRLVHYTPGMRLRVGDRRVLFEVVGSVIIIWRIVHRSEAYD